MTQPDFEGPLHEFVANAHGNLTRVQDLFGDHPEVLEERYTPWNETAMEATAHTGSREVARFLLDKGATPTHGALAMLGWADDLRALLAARPELAQTPGAHGISLLYHAALSGDPATLQAAWDAGARDGLDGALHAAVMARSLDALAWLLERGAGVTATNFSGKTPREAASERGWSEGAARLDAHPG